MKKTILILALTGLSFVSLAQVKFLALDSARQAINNNIDSKGATKP